MKRARTFVATGLLVSALWGATGWVHTASASTTTTLTGAFGVSSVTVNDANGTISAYSASVPPSLSPVQQLGSEQFYYSLNSGAVTPFTSIYTQPAVFNGSNSVVLTNAGAVTAPFGITTTYTLFGNKLVTTMQVTGTVTDLSIFQLATLDLNNAPTPQSNVTIVPSEVTPPNPGVTSYTANVTDNVSTNFTDVATAELPLGPFDALQQTGTLYYYQAGASVLPGSGNLTDNGSFNGIPGTNGQFAFESVPFSLTGSNDQANLTFTEDFGPPVTGVPEPATTVLSVLSLAVLAGAGAGRHARRGTCPA